MAIVSKSFDEPDELVTQPLVSVQVVILGEVYVARQVHQPGWSWSEHVQPIAGTATCQHHHQGVALSGQVEIEMEGGARRIVHAGEAFDIPPGHLSSVVGDEPYVTIEFVGVRGWAKPAESGERIVATLLMTDIVSSTDLAVRLGDAAWKEILAGHGGLEVTTTGDGFIALFDGAARAVRCGAAIRDRAQDDGLQIRAAVHSGEVERQAGNIRGVAVHTVTRIAALAQPGEVLVSAPAVGLLEGSNLELEDAGEHELKGLPGRRRVYRLAQASTHDRRFQ
jgi:class 3 adenylate cyclase